MKKKDQRPKRPAKKMKRVLALLLCSIFTLGMCPAAFAADDTEPSASDAKTVYVYNVESNVTVTAYQIIGALYDEKGNGLTGYEVADGLSIEDLGSPTADEVTDIAAGIYDGDIKSLSSSVLSYDLSEGVYYGSLAAGMWIILVSDSNAVIYNPMIVSNWYTNANLASSLTAGSVDADGNFYEGQWTDEEDVSSRTYVEVQAVYAKSDTVAADLEILGYGSTGGHTSDGEDGADYDIGDTVYFRITTRMPDYSDAYIKADDDAVFTIVFTLSKGLDDISASDVTVAVAGSVYKAASGSFVNYTVSIQTDADGTQTVTVAFSQAFIDEHALESVIVEYDTELNSSAETTGDASAMWNESVVNIIYSNSPVSTISTADTGGGDLVCVYTFSITDEAVKVAPEGSASASGNTVSVTNALPDAEFTIYTDEACTKAYLNSSSDCGEDEYVSTSDENGYISFTGLSEGTYYMTETESPSDHMINDTVYKVVISAKYDTSEGSTTEGMLISYTICITDLDTGDEYVNTYMMGYTTAAKTYEASNGEISYTWYEVDTVTVSASQDPIAIVDPDLIKLPSAGGAGIYVFIALSVLIICAAVIFAVRKNKKA